MTRSSGAHEESSSAFGFLPLGRIQKVRDLLRNSRGFRFGEEAKLFLFVAVVYSFTILPLSSSNERSRFALTKAVVSDRSVIVNSYARFVGIDVSSFQGNFYSTMAPGVSVLLVPFFALGTLFGAAMDPYIRPFGVTNFAAPSQVVMVQLFSSLCSALSAVYVYKLSLLLGSGRSSALLVSLTYAFATPTWVFGKTLFAHTFSAFFLVMAYYFVFLSSNHASQKEILLAGLFSAMALSTEYTNALLVLPGLLYLLQRLRKNCRGVLAFLLPLVTSGSLLLLYNYLCFKNPLSFPEAYWSGYRGESVNPLDRFSTPLDVGLKGPLLSSSRGLLCFSPISALAIPSFYFLGKTKRLEAVTLGSVFLINLFTFARWHMWNGGSSFGPRFLVPSLPFLIIPLFALAEKIRSTRSRHMKLIGSASLMGVFVLSASIISIGAITSPIAGFSDASFLTFLENATGYSMISKGTLRDLAFVLMFDGIRSLGITPSIMGLAFWVFVISLPCLAFLLPLATVFRPGGDDACGMRAEKTAENSRASEYLGGMMTPRKICLGVTDGLRRYGLDLAILSSFWITAFILRLWNYSTIPAPRGDELGEGKLALRVLQGYYPLTNNAKFIRSFFQYVLAGFYQIFGTSSSNARLMAVFFGASTVPLTYLLAKDFYDRRTALISSTLLTVSVAHILIASHVGWSASLTPFFGVLSMYLVERALKMTRKTLFFAAGLALGITLQTHPSSIFLLLALGIYILSFCRARPLIDRRSLFLALSMFTGFTLGCINMIYYNIVNPFASLVYAQNARWTGLSSLTTWTTYASRVQSLSAEYLRMMGEAMVMNEDFTVVLSNLKASFYFALTVISIAYALMKHRNGDRMLLLILGSAWLVLPIGVKGYGFPSPWGGHYVSILLPASYILTAVPLSRLSSKKPRIALLLVLAICCCAVVTSLSTLTSVYSGPPSRLKLGGDGKALTICLQYPLDIPLADAPN